MIVGVVSYMLLCWGGGGFCGIKGTICRTPQHGGRISNRSVEVNIDF